MKKKFLIKKKNKQAQIFSILAILLISLMFLSFELFSFLQENKSVKTRVETMDSFLSSIEENLMRQVYISGFRILFLAENKITSTGEYINVESFFNEAFFNGSVNNEENSILIGATYEDIVNSVNNKAKKINVEVNLSNSFLIINQSDPWNINITLVSDFVMQDKEELAKWEKTQVISTLIPISFFEDPLFIVNSYARVSRKINQTPYEGDYTLANLNDHLDKGFYAVNSFGPSFLKRLEGDLSEDPNGIESFVNIPDFSSQGLITKDKSVVDYIYFSSENPISHTVSGMPSWFKIDSEDNHTEKYGI